MIPIEGVLDKYEVDYDPAKGGNQKILCPFHPDTVASASVNIDLGVFNCYGCPIAGDAIRVLELVEGLDFLEAKRLAEELAGGTRPAVSREPERRNTFLPSKSRSGRGSREWKSPWSSRGA